MRVRRILQVLCLVACASLFARLGLAETEIHGRTWGGAWYSIAVPGNWNGDLVIFNHGLNLTIGPEPDLGPLAQLQLAEGFAVAASSFRQIGWALFATRYDLEALYRVFVGHFGRPGRVWLNGFSLGGLVSAQAIEQADLGNVVGSLQACGAEAGSRNWDLALDLRLIYDDVCADTPDAAIPGGAKGLPWWSTLTQEQIAGRVNACTGVLVPPGLRTPTQTENLDRILTLTKIPESYLVTDMIFATIVMSDLVHSWGKLFGLVGTRNAAVDYGDPEVNATIKRVFGNPWAIHRLQRHYVPNGSVGDVKIVSMHTNKDGLVVVENESAYASVVPPSNLTTAIVVEDAPTHCGFNGAEVVAGWESLRGWVQGAPQPTAASIQGVCGEVPASIAEGPCRIDPTFVVPDIDTRIRPR